MPNQPVLTESQWDDADVTTTEEASGFEAVNLTRNGRSYLWGTEDVTGLKTVKFEAPVARSVSFVVLHYHNGTSAGTFRVRLATTEANLTASPLYDSDAAGGPFSLWATTDMDVLPWKSAFVLLTAPVSATWLQLDISDATNPDGFFRLARLIVGEGFQAAHFPLSGSGLGVLGDDSIIRRSPLGFQSAVRQETVSSYNARWLLTTKTEVERMARAYHVARLTADVGFVANPDATTLYDSGVGAYRFEEEFKPTWQARTGDADVYVRVPVKLRGV